MDAKTTQLHKIYLKLPEVEQRILQVLSVMFEPKKMGSLNEILEKLGWCDSDNNPLAKLVSKKKIEQWQRKSLVTYEKFKLQCSLQIIDALTLETIKNKTFDDILPKVRVIFPVVEKQFDMYRCLMSRPHYVEAQLRIASYKQDNEAVMSILNNSDIGDADKSAAVSNIVQRFIDLDDNLFSSLPDNIKFYGLADPLVEALYHPSNDLHAVKNAERHFPDMALRYQDSVYLLAEMYIFQGRLDDAEKQFTRITTPAAIAIQAWTSLLRGDVEGSVLMYQFALDAMKKGTRKRNVHISALTGIFHIIALLAAGTKESRTIALKQLSLFRKEEKDGYFKFALLQLKDTLEIQNGDLLSGDEYYLTLTHYTQETLHHVLQTVQWLWQGQPVSASRCDELIQGRANAHKLGLHWLVWQISKILEKINKKSPSPKISQALKNIPTPPLDYLDLCDVVKKREAWEIALEALQDITAVSSAEKTTTENDARMSWRIVEDNWSDALELEPREQKLSKSGKWTAGRKVALKKLATERSSYDYLTEQDQKICNHIGEHSYYLRGYPRTDYEIDTSKALLAAVGHPLVFMADNLSTPVELVKQEPRLEIKETANGKSLRLQLVPYSSSGKLAIHKESDQKISLVEYQRQHRHIADILGEKGITVPQKAKQQVMDRISELAPLLTIHSDIAGANTGIETVESQQNLHIHLQPVEDGLKFSAYIQPFDTPQPLFRAGEGGTIVFTEIDHKQVQTQRNLKVEKNKLNKVLRHCPALYKNSQQEWYLDDPELALETLLQLQELPEKDVQLEWPQGKKITLNNAASLSQMSLNIRKSQDWFSVSGELQIDEDNVLEMRNLMDLLSQSSSRFIRLKDKQFLVLTEELRDRLDAIQAYTSDKGQFHPLAIPAIDELSEGMTVKASKPWKDQLLRLQTFNQLKSKPPTTLQAELRDYQLEGFQWLSRLAHWGAGACLADDMGLGKTIQALALILTRCKQGPTLILAPTSVCNNWETEAYRFAPTLNVKRFGQGDRQKMLDDAGAFDLIICSYGLLQSESEKLTQLKWHTIVADEAQAIKNAQAKRTKAAMKLQADFRVITTGTPIENHLGELWSLFNFINPGLLGSLEQFNKKYATPIERDNDHQARMQLKNLISAFILRRLKSDVLKELPPRTEITLKVALSKEEKALYEAIRQQAMENVEESETPGERRMKILAEIMRLRRACCNPRLVMPDSPISSSKLEAFSEILEDLRANNHKALVFSQFVGHLSLVREYLDKLGIEYQYLDGSTPTKKRQQAVNDFQAGEGDLFLISLKAGGSGLNLTAADYVIHLDPWWNPAVEDQASDRAHRIGQKRPVTIYRLVAENTIEEKIVSMHHQKRDLNDRHK